MISISAPTVPALPAFLKEAGARLGFTVEIVERVTATCRR